MKLVNNSPPAQSPLRAIRKEECWSPRPESSKDRKEAKAAQRRRVWRLSTSRVSRGFLRIAAALAREGLGLISRVPSPLDAVQVQIDFRQGNFFLRGWLYPVFSGFVRGFFDFIQWKPTDTWPRDRCGRAQLVLLPSLADFSPPRGRFVDTTGVVESGSRSRSGGTPLFIY